MREGELGEIFLKHLVAAGTWAAVFLIVFFILALGIKQQVKEGIQYTMKMAAIEGVLVGSRVEVMGPAGSGWKEGAPLDEKRLVEGVKAVLRDPEVKKQVMEILESGGKHTP